MSKIPGIYEVFEKRREYPRLRIDLPLQLICSNNTEVDARFFDLSPDGAQIRYSSNTADRLFGKDVSVQALKSVHYRLKTTLSDDGFKEDIQIGFLPVYRHRIDNDTISMGILFDSTDKIMLAKINSFLLYELQPDQAETGHSSGSSSESPRHRLNRIMEAHLNESIQSTTKLAGGPPRPHNSNLDQIRQELLHISSALNTLQECVNEIKRRLGDIERQL